MVVAAAKCTCERNHACMNAGTTYQSCIADQSLSWVRRSDQFIAMIWEKSSDQSSCLNLNLTFYLKLTSDHCAKCVTVIWCDLKIKAKVQVQAWTLIWTFFSDHRNELILIWTLWTIYNSGSGNCRASTPCRKISSFYSGPPLLATEHCSYFFCFSNHLTFASNGSNENKHIGSLYDLKTFFPCFYFGPPQSVKLHLIFIIF